MKKSIWIIILVIVLVIIFYVAFGVYQIYKETACEFPALGMPKWGLCGCGYKEYQNGEMSCIKGCVDFFNPLNCIKGYIQNQNKLIEAMQKDLAK